MTTVDDINKSLTAGVGGAVFGIAVSRHSSKKIKVTAATNTRNTLNNVHHELARRAAQRSALRDATFEKAQAERARIKAVNARAAARNAAAAAVTAPTGSEKRVPAGSAGGGRWTSDGMTADHKEGIHRGAKLSEADNRLNGVDEMTTNGYEHKALDGGDHFIKTLRSGERLSVVSIPNKVVSIDVRGKYDHIVRTKILQDEIDAVHARLGGKLEVHPAEGQNFT